MVYKKSLKIRFEDLRDEADEFILRPDTIQDLMEIFKDKKNRVADRLEAMESIKALSRITRTLKKDEETAKDQPDFVMAELLKELAPLLEDTKKARDGKQADKHAGRA